MSSDKPIVANEFMTSFKGFMDEVVKQAPPPEDPLFLKLLRDHFDQEPAGLPIVAEKFPRSEHPNLHLALSDYIAAEGRVSELLGMFTSDQHQGVKLSQLTQRNLPDWHRPREGPVEYANIKLHDEQVLACVQNGLYLTRDGDQPLAVLVRGPKDHWNPGLEVEVMALERPVAEHFLSTIRVAIRRRNVYRGHVISLEFDRNAGIMVKFHRLPKITRYDIILSQGVLERIERQTVGFARLGQRLREAGRHLKRGLLLYGPPGTGKTLTAMYLASQMPDRTIILITGRGVGVIEESCAMARMLQPATVILEDVDLIAEERTNQSTGTNALLFELLNQMDGLADDADILFLLTTNRPDILEPALAARPGRIDQAMEIPLPDRECRRQLLDLYSRGLTVQFDDYDRVLDQTEGVSAAFIRELMRKATLFAADESEPIIVVDRHINEAIYELVVEGGHLTRRLLGAGSNIGADRTRSSCG